MSDYLARALQGETEVTFRELYEEADRNDRLDAARLNDVFYEEREKQVSRYGSRSQVEPEASPDRYDADHEAREVYADEAAWDSLTEDWLTVLEEFDEAPGPVQALYNAVRRTGRHEKYADLEAEELVDAREDANNLTQLGGAGGALALGAMHGRGAMPALAGQSQTLDLILTAATVGAGGTAAYGLRKRGRVSHEIKHRQLEEMAEEVGDYTVRVGTPAPEDAAAAATGV